MRKIIISVILILLFVVSIYSVISYVQNSNIFDKSPSDFTATTNYLDNDKKYIILTFDDGWSSQYEAFKMMKPLKGTLYICSSLIGQSDRLTLKNLKEMYNSGWDICNHTAHHINLTKVSFDKAYIDVLEGSNWIKNHGFTRNLSYKHFAYPEGGYNDEIIELLKKQKTLTARTTQPGNDTSIYLELGRTSLAGKTPYNIHYDIVSDTKLLILSFHRIVPDDTTKLGQIDLQASYFQEVLNSIRESNREVITITEWYKLANNIN